MDLAQQIAKLSPGQRKLLELKLEQQGIDVLQIPVTPVDRKNRNTFPLSFAQERLWFICQLDPGNFAYNIIFAAGLEGKLDKKVLERSINEIIRRHEILRTVFIFDKEKPVQVILDELTLPLEMIDLGDLSRERQETEIKQFIGAESRFVFDLSAGPLLRTTLLELSETRHVFILVTHHIVYDGTSSQVFIRELSRLYDVFSRGSSTPLRELPVQYVDYACWQRQWFGPDALATGVRKKQEAYWLGLFSGEVPVLNLPLDYPRPEIQGFEGNTLFFGMDIVETKALKEMAVREKTTVYAVLLAIYNVFLSKLSRQEDIVVGTPAAGRTHACLQDLIGMFINTLALRNEPHQNKTFRDFLGEVKTRTLSAFDNQEYRYEDIVGKLKLARDTGRNPLFDIMFLLENFAYADVDIPGLTLKLYEYENKISKFDLTLKAWEAGETLDFAFEYCTKLFKESTVKRFIRYFKQLVGSVVRDFEMRLAEMEIIPGEEKQRILENFNDIQTEYPAGKTIHELFARQAAVTPDGAALVGAGLRALPDRVMQHLTYKELNRKSDQVAQALKEKGVLADDIVAIMVKRSVEMIIGILGILKAGGAYLPIDPGYPQERIDYMVKDSGARVLVSELSEVSKVSEENPTHPTHLTHPTQLCYIIYTSGTTGKPKGVMIEHRNVLNLIVGARHLFDFNGDDTWTVFHSFCFDFSVWEMYGAVLYGGKLIIVPRMTARDPVRFLKVLKNHGVTILNQTPLSFYHLAGEELKHKEKQLKLRYIIFAGDALEPARLKQWREKYPGTRLINMFGITEATVHSTFKEIGDSEIDCNTSNIGKPVVSVSAYVLDENRNLCPWGVPGELYIGGRGVGRGYINRPGLTAERFVSFSYRSYGSHRSYRSIKIYKTGDLVRLRDNGEMEYLGRIDRQVQLRGYRVELGEIEKRLLKHEEITGAAVLAAEGEGSGKYLCAYVVCGREIRVRDLRAYLAKGLPDYMVPSYFIRVERIPLTSNGKLDRKALPEPDGSRLQAGAAYLAPQTGLEQEITDHWLKVLDVDRVGIHDNFFELGGNSLNIMQLNARLKEALARDIPVVSMYKHITVSSFAGYLMEQENRLIHTGKGNRQNRLEETFLQSKKIYTRTLKRTAARKNEREN